MDAVFEAKNFKNEIVWKRTGSHGGPKRWGAIHDTLLFYTGHSRNHWNSILQEHPPEYWEKYYKYEDERGRYQLATLTDAGLKDGDLSTEWRGVDPGATGRHWAVPHNLLQQAYPHRNDLRKLSTKEQLDMLDEAGLVHWPVRGAAPRHKRYAGAAKGVPQQDVITNVGQVGTHSRERMGWPTQKPLKLLELIVGSSSYAGDIVLDPFCGSGTTCVAAENLGRDWIGIDDWPQAGEILLRRLKREAGSLDDHHEFRIRSERPRRTERREQTSPVDPSLVKSEIYARQQGRCIGCGLEMELHHLSIAHIESGSKLAPNERTKGLTLLCSNCDRVKGHRNMDYLKWQLYERGILTD